jgi:hypothetical protein
MAFDAGAIEATLTLNRNPFTAGLAAAKAQVDQWKRRNTPIEIDVKVNLREAELKAIQAKLKRFGGMVARATAEVVVKGRAEFDKLLFDLKWFDKRKFTATVDVDTAKATSKVVAFRTLLGTLNDQTVNLRANTRGFGNDAAGAFEGGRSHFQKMAGLVIGLLPVIASGFTAAVGAAGALSGAFLIAGTGVGALALVTVGAFKSIKAAAAGGQAEINKLPPALRDAGNAMKELFDTQKNLADSSQKLVGIMLAAWFRAGTAALKTLNPLVEASAKAFTNVAERARIFFEGAWWKSFVSWLSANMMPVVSRLGSILFSLLEIVGNLTRAFMDLGGSQILDMIAQGLAEFALYTDKIGQNKTFQEFMDAAVRSLPVVGKLLGDVIVFIFKLAVGLEPLGTLIIRVLNGIFDAVNSLPPETLGALAAGFGAMWLAISLGAGGPVGIAIGVLAGLGTILAGLYEKNENFRTTINNLVDDLKAKWQPIWDTIVKNFEEKILPAWNSLVDITENHLIPQLREFGRVIEQEVWPKIQPLVDEITGTLIPSLLGFLGALERIIGFLVDVFGPTVASEMGDAITVFQGAFDTIAGALDIFTGIFTANWTTFHQGLQEVNRGFWTIIAGMFGTNLEGLRAMVQQWDADIDAMWHEFWGRITGFFQGFWQTLRDMWNGALALIRGDTETAATLIGRAWSRVANFFRDPINWVINTVINDGIIGAWNTVMGWIGVGGISGRVPSIPAFGDAFAMGGAVRGGIPGKDSVPILAQQGEYVLSKPAVDSMGGIAAVDRMHTAARGGATGTRATVTSGLPGYAEGGPVGGLSMWTILGNQVKSLFGGIGSGHAPMGGMIGDAITRIPGALVNKVLEAIQKKLEAIVVAIFGPGGGTGSVVANGALQQMIAATAAQFGWGGSQLAAINWIISHESGGNPNAQNPTSTAYGLFQFLNSTWASVGGSKTSDPAAQILYGLRYIASRYGSPTGAQAFWQSHGWYDNGGILQPGTTLATNNTGRPEAILTQSQLATLTASRSQGLTAADIVALINARDGGGGGDVYNVMLPERATVRELADSLDFKRRVVSKGRYR